MTSPHPSPAFDRSLSVSRERRTSRRVSGRSIPSVDPRADSDQEAPAIPEEINEVKRYEDFTTIDWVQDAVYEQSRRRAKRRSGTGFWDQEGILGWRRKMYESYDAGQAWLVVTLVGMAIGLNSAVLNIITEWLSDIKLGHCTTAFYLNESFCCWGAENGCPEWKHWTSFWLINYVFYFFGALLLSSIAAVLVKSFAPYAAGSGISEIKCIIAGFVMKGFLGAWTLLIKSIALPLAIASGLSVGKEGPSVHFAVCTGNVISRFFGKYKQNASKTREILTASAAAGVAVAFGSPIGGVLFSLEEMASYFPLKTLWRSYFCALVATSVLAAVNPFRTGQLVMFQVEYNRTWHFFEFIFFIFLGVFGGLYGAFVMKWNLRMAAFRKKHLSQWPITESVVLAGLTAILCYPNMFLKINMTAMMEILFRECEGGHDYAGLCEAKNRWSMVFSLAIATVLRTGLVIISYGCKVPAGIFVPSMAVGASFGRMVGIMVQALHESFPQSAFFASCDPDVPCITPGTYAFLGAGAALSGIMHLTISVTVIMFELTGALTYILPTMIVVGVTKAVGDRFGSGGIADRMIWFNGFPFLDNKEDHVFNVPVSHAMTTGPLSVPASDFPVREAEHLLNDNKFQGFPVVEDRTSKILVGYIGRTELRYAIDRARNQGMVAPNARCVFTTEAADAAVERRASLSENSRSSDTFDAIQRSIGAPFVDFSRYVDHTPLTVHPRHPLETVMEIFKKMGPRVILVEHRGKLTGLVTVKDCLKYQFKVEAEDNTLAATSSSEFSTLGAQPNPAPETLEDRLWRLIQSVAVFVSGKVSRRPVRLRDRTVPRQSEPSDVLEGRGDDTAVELEDREDRLMIS
ncbi:Cystathionine beta-synthase core [Penicillium cf. griseofulvum]|uniref:Chloride channel protein n=1 Tax=Penicillium cf. griseofulvum TaxID=2972120 RepID=A0A9W9JPM3_9EURO|nr:Cystathionine beta-synthase core [Penicillium cf. griseofulvum]KAJ5424294.1 Cystathionine beta-synthase core [Penicillium cf. griseofulvum]